MTIGRNGTPEGPADSSAGLLRSDRAEARLGAALRSMHGAHLIHADGVEVALCAFVDELKDEGLLCEKVLLAVKRRVAASAWYPDVLLGDIVPICITHYYAGTDQGDARAKV
jgi:hypothetical protein